VQVGNGSIKGSSHALIWHGTAESVFDLHTLLPNGYENSDAVAIDELGNIVGTAMYTEKLKRVIVIWKPTAAVGR
jgi:hypothetical protein